MQKFYRRILIVMGLAACLLVGAAAVQVRCLEGPAADAREETEARTAEPALTGEPAVPEPEETLQEEAVTAEPETPMASEHFGLWEYACDCAGYCNGWPTEMNPELLERIEALRMACGRPVIITSGVRCEARNEEVGGVSWSFHKKGLAADLYCPGMGVGDLAARAQETGLNILPYYSSGYIHVELPLS